MKCLNAAVASHMLGYSALTNLKVISNNVGLFDWHPIIHQAFAMMLCRFNNFEELGLLHHPTDDLWRQVRAMGGHKRLNSEPSIDDIKSLVTACNQDLPALTQLELHFYQHVHRFHGRGSRSCGAEAHPSLSIVKCSC